MIVKCIKLQQQSPVLEGIGWHNVEDHLTISKSYVVLAIKEEYGLLWVLICDDVSEQLPSKFPYFIPMDYFEIVDDSPSRYWVKKGNMVGFKELVEEKHFYYNLSEESERECDIYMQYKKWIFAESIVK